MKSIILCFYAVLLLFSGTHSLKQDIQPVQICCPNQDEVLFVQYSSIFVPKELKGERIVRYKLKENKIVPEYNKDFTEDISIRLSYNGECFSTYNESKDILSVFSNKKKVFEERNFKEKIINDSRLKNHLKESLDLENNKITRKEICRLLSIKSIMVTENRVILFGTFDKSDCPTPYCIVDIDYRKNEIMNILRLDLDTGLAAPLIPNIEYEKPRGFFIHSDIHKLSFYNLNTHSMTYFVIDKNLECLDYKMIGDDIYLTANKSNSNEEPSLYKYETGTKNIKKILDNVEDFQISGNYLLVNRYLNKGRDIKSKVEIYSLRNNQMTLIKVNQSFNYSGFSYYLLPYNRLYLYDKKKKIISIIDLY